MVSKEAHALNVLLEHSFSEHRVHLGDELLLRVRFKVDRFDFSDKPAAEKYVGRSELRELVVV